MDPAVLAKVIAETANIELQDKFSKGQREHGGDFALKPTVRNIREEVLDLVNYTHVLTQHRSEILIKMDELLKELPTLSNGAIRIRLESIKKQIHDI